jgi:hypothetical protein
MAIALRVKFSQERNISASGQGYVSDAIRTLYFTGSSFWKLFGGMRLV